MTLEINRSRLADAGATDSACLDHLISGEALEQSAGPAEIGLAADARAHLAVVE